jgi:integration host factor subunit beta
MSTITKKELIDRIAEESDQKRVLIKKIVQMFLDEIVDELGKGNRLEFRDFGVFETKLRRARRAQNPRTLKPVNVPEKRTVKFKIGRLMKARLDESDNAQPPAAPPSAGNQPRDGQSSAPRDDGGQGGEPPV